jgi:hypothetical protein
MTALPNRGDALAQLMRIRAAYEELAPEERTPAIARIVQGVEEIARLSEAIDALKAELLRELELEGE